MIPACFSPAVQAIETLVAQRKGPVIVAVDGRCASGKSTFAELCGKFFRNCNIFHMDDFFLPPEMRIPERLEVPGGNVHYERVEREILLPLSQGKGGVYRPFDCSIVEFGSEKSFEVKPLNILEGSYTLHPVLAPYSHLKIFLTCSPALQRKRLERRSPEKLHQFETRWIPLEEAYFEACLGPKSYDLMIKTDVLEEVENHD